MNLKKVLITGSIFLTSMLTLATSSSATHEGVYGIKMIREAGIGYKHNDSTVWKVVNYSNVEMAEGIPVKGTGVINWNKSVYCLKAGVGFGTSSDSIPIVEEDRVLYTNEEILEPVEIRNTLGSSIHTNTRLLGANLDSINHNAMLWVLDNAYLPKHLPEEQKQKMRGELLTKAFAEQLADGTINSIDKITLTDDQIEMIQQLAVWYFTNADEAKYHVSTLGNINKTIDPEGKITENISLEEQEDAGILYKYFITEAEKAAPLYATTRGIPTMNVDNTIKPTLFIEGDKALIGPVKINITEIDKIDNFEIKIEAKAEEQIVENLKYSIVKEDKQTPVNGIEDINEKMVYIVANSKDITEVNITVSAVYNKTIVTKLTATKSQTEEQPLAIVEKQNIPINKSFTIKKEKQFDLALRKFITAINGQEITSREPKVDISKLKEGSSTTAIYTHPKTPVSVQTGNIVTYTIRIYNEGAISGYAEKVTDNIPEGLEFIIDDATNIEYMWKLSDDGKQITTNYLSKNKDEGNLILGFDSKTMQTLHYKELKVNFKVIEPNTSNKILVNIAEIEEDSDKNGDAVVDRDSTPNNKIEDEDDIDKEYVKLEYFDLALRKFISSVNGKEQNPSREPKVDTSELKTETSTTAKYIHPKKPVAVQKGDKVVYTIRVYNEGGIAGYAEEITDYLPEGLNFIPSNESEINSKYGWQVSEDGKTIKTNYLSEAKTDKNSNEPDKNFLIDGFDKETETTLDYRDLKIECEVVEPNTSERVLRNIAEITNDSNNDVDSNPNNLDIKNYNPPKDTVDQNGNIIPGDNSKYQEDDDDYEDLVLQYFDLALRKFITQINEQIVDTRYPEVTLGENGKLEYDHPKDALLVANNDIVIYTIRVFNEGKMSGYASEITDDIPNGLTYLPEHEINKKYGWTLSQDGKTISTNYLSKEKSEERNEDNLINSFDKNGDISDKEPFNPDYRDVQIAFKVTEKNLPSSRTIINTAEITNDQDENGEPVQDEDSEPGNGDPEEDDIDKEYLKVKYFDLSLLKWVNKVYITENGKTEVTQTGHTGLEKPEPIVKVDLHRKKIDKVTVKFGYVIKITNEGEIAGYATEISDYIPKGLKFIKEDNPSWEEKDGKIVTRALENTLLEPGQSGEVEVILTWENSGENMGKMVNIAEISEDKNDPGAKDIDSVPNNQKEGEDDIDDAPVLLTVETGGAGDIAKYITLGTAILAILAIGIFVIKKYVL